jgi:hypothetical protein
MRSLLTYVPTAFDSNYVPTSVPSRVILQQSYVWISYYSTHDERGLLHDRPYRIVLSCYSTKYRQNLFIRYLHTDATVLYTRLKSRFLVPTTRLRLPQTADSQLRRSATMPWLVATLILLGRLLVAVLTVLERG